MDEFKYSELSEKAQQRAREGMYESQTDFNWWEGIYDDAVRALATVGIEIGQKANRTADGKIFHDPSIWFAGFSCQGDGCSFEGMLRVTNMKECEGRAKEYAPTDEALHALAVRSQDIFNLIIVEQVRQRLLGETDSPECHESAVFLISSSGRGFSTKLNSNDELPFEIEGTIDDWLDDVADWIYGQLEQEYDYLTSDESLATACEGYLFDEDGNPA